MQAKSRYKQDTWLWPAKDEISRLRKVVFLNVFGILIALCFLAKSANSSDPAISNLISQTTHLLQQQQTQPGRQQTKNSGQFLISQICAGKSQPPYSKIVEGAVLMSEADTDVNCTVTFRTRSSYQHFVIRFEELRLGCNDHLKIFDGDTYYGQPSFKDFSCKDSLASVPIINTSGAYLTIRYSTDGRALQGDGFKFVATAVFHDRYSDCPIDHALCRNQLCIPKSLFCDGINHCLDNSDENNCAIYSNGYNGQSDGGWFSFGAGTNSNGDLSLSNALVLLVILVLIIFACVILFIVTVNCRRENHYAQYQHQLQATAGPYGVPLQTSPSVMFTSHPQHWSNHHILPQPPITVPCHIVYDNAPRTNALLQLQNQ